MSASVVDYGKLSLLHCFYCWI